MSRGINQFTTPRPNLEPSYELSYLLGVLKGDGCIYRTRRKKCFNCFEHIIQLAVRDEEFAEYFSDILYEIFLRKVSIIKYLDERQMIFYKVAIRSKSFYEWYNSKNEKELYEIASRFPSAFVKGVFDSEGNLSYYKNYPLLRICSSNRQLIELLQKWLNEYYGINSKITIKLSEPRIINNRICNFKKDVYILKITNRNHIQGFFKYVGTSIGRKNMEVDSMAEARCMRCRQNVEITEPEEVIMKNGMKAIKGKCGKCGTKVFRIMGKA